MKIVYRFGASLTFSIALIMFGFSGQLSAQTATQRLSIIEEFTSATCYPCTTATEVLKPIVSLSNGVIAIRYHLYFPVVGDPFYMANKSENETRSRLYFKDPGLPAAKVNGNIEVNPQQANDVTDAIKLGQAQPYPVKIEISHDKTNLSNVKVNVKVTSDIPLSNYTLHAVVVASEIHLDKLPLLPDAYTETLEHWNHEKEFTDAMLKMLPDTNGTQVTILPGTPASYDFSYTAKTGDIWKTDQLNIIAFLQNNVTKEIIQAATTVPGQVGSMVGTTMSFTPSVEPMFVAANANETAETKIVIGNVGKTAMQYTGLSITKAPRTPSDWSMTTDSFTPDFTLDPGKSKEIVVKLTRGTSAGSGAVEITFKETGGRTLSAIPITMVAKETEGFLVTDNPTRRSEPFASAIAARTTKKNYTEISGEHIARYSQLFPNFKRMIWNEADSGVVSKSDFAFINSAMKNGKSVFVSGQRTTYEAAFNDVKGILDTMGVVYSGLSKVTPFTIKGVAGDPISDGFNETCVLANYPLYKLLLPKTPKPGVTPFLSVGDTIVGVRYQSPTARMIYMNINPAAIQNTVSRNALLDKALTWLESFTFTPLAKLSSVETLDFGAIAGPNKLLPITLNNVGNTPFEVSEIGIKGADSAFFSQQSGGPGMLIPLGASQQISVIFSPTESRAYNAVLEIKSAAPGAEKLSVVLKGSKTPIGVNEGNSLPLQLEIQPNPANEKVSVTFSTQSNQKTTLQLCDLLGNVVRRFEITDLSIGDHTSVIETAGLSAGKYTIVLISGEQRTQAPLMIVR